MSIQKFEFNEVDPHKTSWLAEVPFEAIKRSDGSLSFDIKEQSTLFIYELRMVDSALTSTGSISTYTGPCRDKTGGLSRTIATLTIDVNEVVLELIDFPETVRVHKQSNGRFLGYILED